LKKISSKITPSPEEIPAPILRGSELSDKVYRFSQKIWASGRMQASTLSKLSWIDKMFQSGESEEAILQKIEEIKKEVNVGRS